MNCERYVIGCRGRNRGARTSAWYCAHWHKNFLCIHPNNVHQPWSLAHIKYTVLTHGQGGPPGAQASGGVRGEVRAGVTDVTVRSGRVTLNMLVFPRHVFIANIDASNEQLHMIHCKNVKDCKHQGK